MNDNLVPSLTEKEAEIRNLAGKRFRQTDMDGMKKIQVFVDKYTRDKSVRELKTRDAAAKAMADYINEMPREGMPMKCVRDADGQYGKAHRSGHLNRME